MPNGYTRLVQATTEAVGRVNARFSASDKLGRRFDANAFMLSKCLDLLVESKVITEEQREGEMSYLYREIGVL